MKLSEPLKIRLATEDGAASAMHCSADSSIRVAAVDGIDAEVLYVTASVSGAVFPSFDAIKISYKIDDAEEGVAIHRHSTFWCRPEFFGADCAIPAQTQEALIKLTDGSYIIILPLVGNAFRTTLEGENGVVSLSLEAYNPETECRDQPSAVICRGNDPFELFDRVARAASAVLGDKLLTVDKKVYPEIFEYLGWCTWDAMHIHVNAEGVREKLKEIKEKNVPIRWAILDDMWADVKGIKDIPLDSEFIAMVRQMHRSKLYSYEADPERFPEGIEGYVKDVHEAGLKAGIWYPATGYWSGFDPEGDAARIHSLELTQNASGNLIISPEKEKAEKVYNSIAKHMKDAGIDFLKIDNQSCYRNHYFNCGLPVGRAAESIEGAIVGSAKEYFDDALINCMGMANEVMFNRGESCVSRCSDDFSPNNSAWFAKHILQCAYNGLLQGKFFVNDWDMWWTSDPQGKKNSLCRAISGGPIYVSDRIGETDPEVLRPTCFDDGRIIRTEESARPMLSCLTSDPRKSGKPIFITSKKNGCSLVAVFNINENGDPVKGELDPVELGFDSCEIYSYFDKTTAEKNERGAVEISLPTEDDFGLFVIAPIESDGRALFGVDGKFIMPGTFERTESGVSALCGGEFIFASESGELIRKKVEKGDII